MIEINVSVDPKFVTLEVNGHAGYNPGNDIVCAAISALAMTFVGATKAVDALVDYKDNSGEFIACAESKPETKIILNTVVIGMLQIEKTYPENVKINLENCNQPKIRYNSCDNIDFEKNIAL